MGIWSINDLDKQKTELCISNETARLNICKEKLDKLKKEYEDKRYEYSTNLANLEDKITELETSIFSGEKFLNECKNHKIKL